MFFSAAPNPRALGHELVASGSGSGSGSGSAVMHDNSSSSSADGALYVQDLVVDDKYDSSTNLYGESLCPGHCVLSMILRNNLIVLEYALGVNIQPAGSVYIDLCMASEASAIVITDVEISVEVSEPTII